MFRKLVVVFFIVTVFIHSQGDDGKKGNVIFIHPDGTSLADWNALRILKQGPDGELNWDKLSEIGLYQGHIKNNLTSSSNAGATIHAYGVKVNYDEFGMDEGKIPLSRSGQQKSIMQEAIESGIASGIINSGSIIEPGTAVFVASSEKRSNYAEITKKVILSGADLIFSGGEEWMLPEGVKGRHAAGGTRKDGINLIEEAKKLGYTVIYDRNELKAADKNSDKILGVFASIHTFNDKTEEDQKAAGLQDFDPNAPTLKEMTEFALDFLSKKGQFFLVVEEEGTDNFGNKNNAKGKLEALNRADEAIGSVIAFIEENPNTMLVTAADSEAGGMEVVGLELGTDPEKPVEKVDKNAPPVDGREGFNSKPFLSAPDKHGVRYPFVIMWSTSYDVSGSVVARAHGLNADRMRGKIDNTDIYRLMYLTLFGTWLE